MKKGRISPAFIFVLPHSASISVISTSIPEIGNEVVHTEPQYGHLLIVLGNLEFLPAMVAAAHRDRGLERS
jgi:hypothetical protein